MTAPLGSSGLVGLALQAGGASTRMGTDKALVPFAGGSLIEWMLHRTVGLFPTTIVVSNEPSSLAHLGVPVVTDAVSERGSVVGIYTSLLASSTPYVLCLACDMPFVPRELLRELALAAPGWDAFVPRHGDYLEPLVAVYRREALDAVRAFVAEGNRRIDHLYGRLNTGYLDVADGRFGDLEHIFSNVNTREQLERARILAEDLTAVPGTATRGGTEAAPVSSERTRRFLERMPIPVISVVGRKNSGKTTLMVELIAELVARGMRVGAVKHDRHGFELDLPGTDTHRFRAAGSVATAISGPASYAWIHDVGAERGLEGLIARMSEPVDMVITEGYKHGPAPKVEVVGGGLPGDPSDIVSPFDELLAVVGIGEGERASPHGLPDSVVRLRLEEVGRLADLLTERLGIPVASQAVRR